MLAILAIYNTIAGLFVHGFVVLPTIYTVVTRNLPFKFIANMTNAFTTAFGTGSSSATLPVTIGLLETKNKVDSRISRSIGDDDDDGDDFEHSLLLQICPSHCIE